MHRNISLKPSLLVLAVRAALLAIPVAGLMPATALAQSAPATHQFDIPAGALSTALTRLAAQAGVQLTGNAELTAGKTASALKGTMTTEQALERLLAGSGAVAGSAQPGIYTLKAAPVGKSGEATLAPLTVTAGAETAGAPPRLYAGKQTARGGKVGILGNKDFLDTPFSTTNYTSELIANQNAKTVGDVLQNDPSVRFTTPVGHMVENLYIRGFLVTADNMAMNGLYGVAPYGHVPTEFIERVEILKGPSALVNGMAPGGAIGGTVNLVPKRAEDTPITRVGIDFESGSQVGTNLDIGRRFGDEHEFGVRFNGAYRDGETEVDGQSKTRELAAVALDYRGERLRLNLDAYSNTEKTENGSPLMISFLTNVIAPPDSSTNLFKGTHSEMHNQGLLLRGEFDFNEHLTAWAGFGIRRNEYSGYINGTRANNVRLDGGYTSSTSYQNNYTDSKTYEVGMRGKFTTGPIKHEVVLAATGLALESGNISRSSANSAANIYAPVNPRLAAHPGDAPKTGETTLSGIALADTLSILDDKLGLTLGLRSQRVEDTSYNATTGAITADYDKRVTTPAVGLVVKPWNNNFSLYANYIEGLSRGDTAPSSAANPNQAFAPYVSQQKEIGAKLDAGRYAHTLALYEISQPSMVRDAATNIYSTDGEKRVRGIEWTVMGQILSDVRLLGGVTLAEGKQMKTSNGTNDGKDAYGMPAWQGNLGLEWDMPWLPGLTLSGRVVHTDKQYLNSANTLEIPSWTRYDAGARYTTKIAGQKTTLRANVINLFDKDYWAGPYHGEGYTTLSAPRTLSLSATMDF